MIQDTRIVYLPPGFFFHNANQTVLPDSSRTPLNAGASDSRVLPPPGDSADSPVQGSRLDSDHWHKLRRTQ